VTGRAWTLVGLLALAVVAGAALWLRWESGPPTLAVPSEVVVGRAGSDLTIEASDAGSGLRSLRVVLRHAQGERVLAERSLPGNRLVGGPRPHEPLHLALHLAPKALGLVEGQAFLVVEARDWSWAGFTAGNLTRVEIPVLVDLTPPTLSVETGLTYVRRGGAAAVVYRVGEEVPRDGVQVGDDFFRGYPLPGSTQPGLRVAIFAVARDAPASPRIRVVAEDRAGNLASARWPTRLQERSFDEVRLNLSHSFMQGKVRELARHLGIPDDDPVAAFQKINTDIRAANEARIREIAAKGGSQQYWKGAFHQMRSSAVTSRFAEHRRYFLDGTQISEAIHYGYDLASTAGAPIQAAAAGRVLFDGDLGIYGNCVILDHGLGIRSLYGHLRRLDVKAGQRVAQDAVLGRSDSTGLAGGDHLHFAILVGGTYVDPKEWWDPRWVRDHVEAKLAQ